MNYSCVVFQTDQRIHNDVTKNTNLLIIHKGWLLSQFARIKFPWDCCIYCITQWEIDPHVWINQESILLKQVLPMDAAILNISYAHGAVHLLDYWSSYMTLTWRDEIYCCQETTHAFAFTTLPRNHARVCLPIVRDSLQYDTVHWPVPVGPVCC